MPELLTPTLPHIDRVSEVLDVPNDRPLPDIEVALSDAERTYRRISILGAHVTEDFLEHSAPVLELSVTDTLPQLVSAEGDSSAAHLRIELGGKACLNSAHPYGLESLLSPDVSLELGFVKTSYGNYLLTIIDPDSASGSHLVVNPDEQAWEKRMKAPSREDEGFYPDSSVDYASYGWLHDPTIDRPTPFINEKISTDKRRLFVDDEV
jgi:hypothetical protein